MMGGSSEEGRIGRGTVMNRDSIAPLLQLHRDSRPTPDPTPSTPRIQDCPSKVHPAAWDAGSCDSSGSITGRYY